MTLKPLAKVNFSKLISGISSAAIDGKVTKSRER
jgi:hypothetical protein